MIDLFVPSFPKRLWSLSSLICTSSVKLLGIQLFLQIDTQFFSKRFEIAQVLIVLALVLDFGFNTCEPEVSVLEKTKAEVNYAPSKTRTAVGKSLTLLAALRAAVMTEGDGTRS